MSNAPAPLRVSIGRNGYCIRHIWGLGEHSLSPWLQRQLNRNVETAEDYCRGPNFGLWPVILREQLILCERLGCQPEAFDPGPGFNSPAVPRPDRIPHGKRVDVDLFHFTAHQVQGLIRYGPGVKVWRLIAQLVLVYPDATFAIGTDKIDQAKQIRRKLQRWGVEATLVTANSCPEEPGRVVIGTYVGFAHGNIECPHRTFFLCADARTALHYYPQLCLEQTDARFRLFGFLPAGAKLPASRTVLLRRTFGFAECNIPVHGRRYLNPEVAWYPLRLARTRERGDRSLRHHLLHNEVRNRKIAKLARKIADGLHADLAGESDEAAQLAHIIADTPPGQVVVLVPGIDEALALRRRLDWALVVDHEHRLEDGLTEHQRTALRPGWNDYSRCIVTEAGFRRGFRFAGDGLIVVIWAGAEKHLPPMPYQKLSVPAEWTATRLLLIDLDERYHPNLLQWTNQRKQRYRQAEWHAPGQNPLTKRVERFYLRHCREGNA